MARIKRKIQQLSYTTDYDGDLGTATVVDFDMNTVYAENSTLFAETPEFADLLDGRQFVTEVAGEASYALGYSAAATTFRDVLRDGVRVHVVETYQDGGTLVVGGENGVSGTATLTASSYFALVARVTASGADAGDAYEYTEGAPSGGA